MILTLTSYPPVPDFVDVEPPAEDGATTEEPTAVTAEPVGAPTTRD